MTLKKWIRQKYLFLYSKILKEKATPEYIARGWAIGMFYGCLVPFGLQLACSIPTSFLLKGSKIGATFGTLLTNHFTVFVIYPAQCWVGNKLMGGDLSYAKIEEAMMDVISKGSWAALLALGGELVAAFFIGAAILTAVMTPVTYFGVLHLVRRYRKAKEKKKRPYECRGTPPGSAPPAARSRQCRTGIRLDRLTGCRHPGHGVFLSETPAG